MVKNKVIAEEVKKDFGKKNRTVGRVEGVVFIAALVGIMKLLKL